MDVDAEGEEDDEDAEGEEDYEMTPAQPPPAIKISKPVKTSPSSRKKTKQITPKKAAGQSAADGGNNSDDDELSDLDSDDEVMNLGDEDAEGEDDEEDMDAEGEEIEEDQDAEGEPEPDIAASSKPGEVDSDDEGSDGEAPDLSRMTQRQRARFEGLDESHYQALSNGMCPCWWLGSPRTAGGTWRRCANRVDLQRSKLRSTSLWKRRPCDVLRWLEDDVTSARSAMRRSRLARLEPLVSSPPLQQHPLISQ